MGSYPRSILRPHGSPCPECGAPIIRKESVLTPGEMMMRCPRCGWHSCWRPSGVVLPDTNSMEAVIDDLNWLWGTGPYAQAEQSQPAESFKTKIIPFPLKS